MRTILSTALLLIAFAAGQAGAAELTAAQAQQILGAAQQAKAGGDAVEVKLTIDGQEIVFKVTRDAVGNIVARPVPTGDSAKAGIAQASIGSTVADSGALVPNSLVQVNTDQTVVTYNITLNQDGTIANLYRPGQALANGLPPAAPVADKKDDAPVFVGGGGGFTLTITLPAGTSPGQSRPPSQAGL
jgi:hypothetical protein